MPPKSMYHIFQAAPAVRPQTDDGDQRRISTSNACIECRRKKIRCGGGQPCQQCTSGQRAEMCKYGKRSRRTIPSRSLVEQLEHTVDQHALVCERLFPGHKVADLATLDHNELLQLALSHRRTPQASPPIMLCDEPQVSLSPHRNVPPEPARNDILSPVTIAPSASSLSQMRDGTLVSLDRPPELDTAADEVTDRRFAVNAVSDDVNGLSFSLEKTSSYVGVSSVNAALKAIFKVAPGVQSHLQRVCPPTVQPSRAPSPSPPPSVRSSGDMDPFIMPAADVAKQHIDSYFDHVHALMPMIDEDTFRHDFLYESRRDAPWLALFNVVLALGSLASGKCVDLEHVTYARRAQQILRQRSLGSNNLFILQAHGLLSGWYLHYLNRPNEAHAKMGATMRMASAVGIHREYDVSCTGNRAVIPPEIRRRTWWSLVCLDTWASMTTGRPSFGRLGPGISVRHPNLPQNTNNQQYLASLKLLPLVHNLAFCTLATRIQDLLATKPLLSPEELTAEDAKLVEWHDNLPPVLRYAMPEIYSHNGCPPSSGDHRNAPSGHTIEENMCPVVLRTPRAIMSWWYLNLRILMHRPYLIAASLCRVAEAQLSEQDRNAIKTCRSLAGQAIATIDQTCDNNLIAGWNGVWLMYQAVMVPLLSLSAFYTTEITASGDATAAEKGSTEDPIEWQNQVQTAIKLFERMSSFSLAAAKSKKVVEQIFHACKDKGTARQPGPLEAEHRGLNGDPPFCLDPNDLNILDFDVQDPDMGMTWDDMAWESWSNPMENIMFTDTQLREFQDAFDF